MSDLVANPQYRPDWETLYDAAAARRALAADALRTIGPLPTDGTEAHAELSDMMDEANRLCCQCLDTFQHPTLNACLDWLDQQWPLDQPVQLRLKDYTTTGDLIGAFCREREAQKSKPLIVANCLPLTKPGFLRPFSYLTDVRSVFWTLPSTERVLEIDGGVVVTGHREIDVTLTVHTGITRSHIALQNATENQASVMNFVEEIAGYFHDNAGRMMNLIYGDLWGPRIKSKITFYIYMRPTRDCREIFDRVDFGPKGAKFQSLGSVPSAVRPSDLPDGLSVSSAATGPLRAKYPWPAEAGVLH